MGTVRRVVIGLFSVVFFLGGVTMVTPFGSKAEAAPKPKKDDSNHTLRWDRILDSTDGDDNPTMGCNSERFKCIFGGDAVLDKETGLVWEQSPGETDGVAGITSADEVGWSGARVVCAGRTVGDRKGWRMPSVHELASLVDPGNFEPALPGDHPFSNVQFGDPLTSPYWSATSLADSPTDVWFVDFRGGSVADGGKNLSTFVWCVRGGHNDGSVY